MRTTKGVNLFNRSASNSRLLSKFLPLVAPLILAAQHANAQTLQWATSYNGIPASALEEVEGVAVDNSGNVFATGLSGTKTIGSVIRTMKLDAKGNILWNVTHSQASLCGGMWGRTSIALDASGNLLVVGAQFTSGMDNWNPLLLKLSPSGAVLGTLLFNLGPFASLDAVAVDASGIYILGHNNPNNGNPHVVQTLKLAPGGTVLWSESSTPATFWGTLGGIVVKGGTVYTAAGGRLTARDLQGDLLWEKDMILPNGGSPLAADAAGNLYLAAQNGVAKFDSAGNALGSITISGMVSALDLDTSGNIYVAGSTPASSRSGSDILTQKYNASGTLVWSTTYGKNGQYSDNGIAVTVRGGYVYVGGSKYNKDLDMCTLKYTAGN
jgi:outer membrane protein assembly factor BamB